MLQRRRIWGPATVLVRVFESRGDREFTSIRAVQELLRGERVRIRSLTLLVEFAEAGVVLRVEVRPRWLGTSEIRARGFTTSRGDRERLVNECVEMARQTQRQVRRPRRDLLVVLVIGVIASVIGTLMLLPVLR